MQLQSELSTSWHRYTTMSKMTHCSLSNNTNPESKLIPLQVPRRGQLTRCQQRDTNKGNMVISTVPEILAAYCCTIPVFRLRTNQCQSHSSPCAPNVVKNAECQLAQRLNGWWSMPTCYFLLDLLLCVSSVSSEQAGQPLQHQQLAITCGKTTPSY